MVNTSLSEQCWVRTSSKLGLAALWVLLTCVNVRAQDPFEAGTDTTTDAFSNPVTDKPNDPTTAAGSSYLNTDPLINRIRENPPKTPTEMAQAISWMVKMRSFDQVGGLLDRLSAANWPAATRAETARAIDPAVWAVLLRSSGKLKEAQNKTLNALYGSPVEHAKNPAVIDANIDRLGSSNFNDRRLAQLRLHDGQINSLKRLLERLLEGDSKAPANQLVATIAQFDIDGIEALRAGCCMPDATKRSRVLVGVAELSDNKWAWRLPQHYTQLRFLFRSKQPSPKSCRPVPFGYRKKCDSRAH